MDGQFGDPYLRRAGSCPRRYLYDDGTVQQADLQDVLRGALSVLGPLGVPLLYFMLSDSLLIFDRAKQTLRLCVNAHVGDDAHVHDDRGSRPAG